MALAAVKKQDSGITLGQLVMAETVLRRLVTLPLPVKTAYHLGRLTKRVQEETTMFQEQRNTFIKELGAERDLTPEEAKESGPGRVLEVTPDNAETFASRMQDLSEIKIKVTDWLLTLDLLADIKLSAVDIMLLEPLFAPQPSSSVD